MTMRLTQYVKNVLDRNETILFKALDGLTTEDLHRQPAESSNPIAWLTWHLSRTQDTHVSVMQGKDQCWTTERWYERFGRSSDPEDRGRGHTAQQVAEFRAPDVDTLQAYYRAVRACTDAFLDGLTEADLDKPVPNTTGDGMWPLQQRLEMFVVDNIQHAGQVAYLRGLLKGPGWLGN